MVSLPRNFDRFSDNISLDETRRGRIQGALNKLQSVVEGDNPLREYVLSAPFSQGSYSYNTAIKPVKIGGEFDVDVVLPINAARDGWFSRSPDDVLNHLATRLRTYYDQRVSRRNRCVRIEYAGDFHIDVVPGWAKDGVHYVPDRSEGSWRASNPAGFTAWVRQQNAKSGMRMVRAVKFLKFWRDHRFGGDVAPKSVLLTALAGYYANPEGRQGDVVPADDDAGYLHNLVWALHTWGEKQWWKPSIPNPTLTSEDLAARWSSEGWDQFKKRLGTLANRIDDAYHDTDRQRSAVKWQSAFGEGFPGYVV